MGVGEDAFDPIYLLERVGEVASLAGEAAQALTQRRFDAARLRHAEFTNLPPARRICERLGVSWAVVLRLAAMSSAARPIGYMHAVNRRDQEWLTLDYVLFTLRLVAARVGRRTLSPAVYGAERLRMLAEDRGRWMHGGQLRLPSEHQVVAVAGSWDRALADAGLAARLKVGQKRRTAVPTIADILDRCYEAHGAQPTQRESELFARANGVPYPRREPGRPWSSYLREWKRERRTRGLAVPTGPARKGGRPDFAAPVLAPAAGERRSRKSWGKRDECALWVARFLQDLGRRQRSSQRAYDLWARSADGAPWSSAFDQHGGWGAVRALAWERLRSDGRQAAPARATGPSRSPQG